MAPSRTRRSVALSKSTSTRQPARSLSHPTQAALIEGQLTKVLQPCSKGAKFLARTATQMQGSPNLAVMPSVDIDASARRYGELAHVLEYKSLQRQQKEMGKMLVLSQDAAQKDREHFQRETDKLALAQATYEREHDRQQEEQRDAKSKSAMAHAEARRELERLERQQKERDDKLDLVQVEICGNHDKLLSLVETLEQCRANLIDIQGKMDKNAETHVGGAELQKQQDELRIRFDKMLEAVSRLQDEKEAIRNELNILASAKPKQPLSLDLSPEMVSFLEEIFVQRETFRQTLVPSPVPTTSANRGDASACPLVEGRLS